MIGYIKGKVIELDAFQVLVLTESGIGYTIHIPLYVSEKLQGSKELNVEFYLYHHQSETSDSLYGFHNSREKMLFEFLLTLPGIGPKIILNMFSYIGPVQILNAITQANAALLTKTPGIGKAKAEKILFEANTKANKIKKILYKFKGSDSFPLENELEMQLTDALLNLGFNSREIDNATQKVKNDKSIDYNNLNLQQAITVYLKFM